MTSIKVADCKSAPTCECYSQLVPERATDLQTAIKTCVIRKSATAQFMPNYGGFAISSHSGLTTYISQERYSVLNESYKTLKWYKAVFGK